MVIPIDVAAAAMAPRGIHRSSLRVCGHGIAARCAVTECDPIAQSKRKNKMLVTGTKKSTTSQSGFPASRRDRKSTRLNSSHSQISYAVFCLKKNLLDDNGVADADLEGRGLAAQALRNQLQRHLAAPEMEGVGAEEGRDNLGLDHPQGAQDDR